MYQSLFKQKMQISMRLSVQHFDVPRYVPRNNKSSIDLSEKSLYPLVELTVGV